MRTIGSHGTALIERSDWAARPPKGSYSSINPTEGDTAHWEGPSIGWPWDHAACYSLVRGIQNYHMDSTALSAAGAIDIAYNAVVCPHGYVFEGRGPGARSAAQISGNPVSYAICFLAGVDDEFTAESKRAWVDAREWLIAEGGASATLHTHGPDWVNTQCPGDERRDWVRAGLPLDGAAPAPAPVPPPVWTPPAPPVPDMGHIAMPFLYLARPYLRSPAVGLCQGLIGFGDNDRDSVFGPHTREGVIWNQTEYGLSVDGRCGNQTWTALVQARLNRDHGENLRVDGLYQRRTTDAVARFQNASGLRVDGIAGIYTITALAG